MKVVLASGNQKKIRELTEILAPLSMEVVPQSAFDVEEAEETGLTFVENAIIKARNAARATGLPALADDSGIEVDALNGQPGIYSARFSGADATDARNNALLIEKLAGVADTDRGARYRAVIVFMRHADDPMPVIAEGTWEGRIIDTPLGEGGFGYDPHFFVPALGKTAAQLSAEQKHAISHRGMALRALLEKLGATT
ncbi:MAG: RdgB/HAM1 family non-canonical purine NTP pyrophosphatase [Alcanivoracaceae bacterium]|jgi:XTP/dITP diphosphohydrolase|nr:RdgB/HAM1 family non-canonical purine NTP pyrophosphatase [Alcanivoracaceae bacterium]